MHLSYIVLFCGIALADAVAQTLACSVTDLRTSYSPFNEGMVMKKSPREFLAKVWTRQYAFVVRIRCFVSADALA
jgi:hypothetical protein